MSSYVCSLFGVLRAVREWLSPSGDTAPSKPTGRGATRGPFLFLVTWGYLEHLGSKLESPVFDWIQILGDPLSRLVMVPVTFGVISQYMILTP